MLIGINYQQLYQRTLTLKEHWALISDPVHKYQDQKQSNTAPCLSSMTQDSSSQSGLTLLPFDYQPNAFDVICRRGKGCIKHTGNITFQQTAKCYLKRYSESATKAEKSHIVSEIICTVKDASPNGGFIKKIGDQWYVADDHLAREKVSQKLRNLLHGKYKSSTKAKKMTRKLKGSIFDDEVGCALSQLDSSGGDVVLHRVEELTAEAKTESDFQRAFNQANIELLRKLKMIQPLQQARSSSFDHPQLSLDDTLGPLPLPCAPPPSAPTAILSYCC